jgi:hypothetical protein
MRQSQKPNQQPGGGQQIPDQQRNPEEDQDLPGQAQRQSDEGQQAEDERRQGERRKGERRKGGNDVERDDSDDAASERS